MPIAAAPVRALLDGSASSGTPAAAAKPGPLTDLGSRVAGHDHRAAAPPAGRIGSGGAARRLDARRPGARRPSASADERLGELDVEVHRPRVADCARPVAAVEEARRVDLRGRVGRASPRSAPWPGRGRRRGTAGRWSGWPRCRSAARGRSAVTTTRGTWLCDASSTAGCRLATAVPDVVTTATGGPGRLGQPERQEAGAALVDPDVQPEQSDLGRRRRARGQRTRCANPATRTTSRTSRVSSASTMTRAQSVASPTTGLRTRSHLHEASLPEGVGRRVGSAPLEPRPGSTSNAATGS